MVEFDAILTSARVLLHLGVALILLSYHPHGARHRLAVSLLATLMAASNLGLGVALLAGALDPRSMGGQWLHIGALISLFCLILMCRGNVAKMIPNRSHGAR
jgi:hypothetical protein